MSLPKESCQLLQGQVFAAQHQRDRKEQDVVFSLSPSRVRRVKWLVSVAPTDYLTSSTNQWQQRTFVMAEHEDRINKLVRKTASVL